MKKIITTLMILTLTAAVFPMQSSASVKKKDAYKAYIKWINASENKDYKKYKLMDINKDGVNELIATYYSPMFGTDQYAVLTYDGKEVQVKEARSGVASAGGDRGGTGITKANGRIVETSISSGTGSEYNYITVIKKGKFVQSVSLTDEFTYDYNTGVTKERHTYNNKTISSSKYKQLFKKYFSGKDTDLETVKYVSRSKIKKQLK